MDQPAVLIDSQNASSSTVSSSSLVGEHSVSTLFPHDSQASRRSPLEDDNSPLHKRKKRRKKKEKQGNRVSCAKDLDDDIVSDSQNASSLTSSNSSLVREHSVPTFFPLDPPQASTISQLENASSLTVSSAPLLVEEHSVPTFFPHDPQEASRRSPLDDESSPLHRRKKTRKEKQGNRVSFAKDFDDDIVEEDENRSSLTREEDIADNWLSPTELRHIRQDARQTAADYRENHASDSSQDIDRLFNAVSQESSLITSDPSHSEICYIPDQCRQSCRGLESQVYTIIRNHGRRYTNGILKVQSKLPADINPEMKARLLRARSLQLSKPSRMLAKFLAYGDAVEVRELFVQEQ
jgi:hypothetical protein